MLYDDRKQFFEEHKFSLENSLEDFITHKRLRFRCPFGHNGEIKDSYFKQFKNKKILCSICRKNTRNDKKLNDLKDSITELTGHEIVEYNNCKKTTFICCNCAENVKSSLYHLKNSIENCYKCRK